MPAIACTTGNLHAAVDPVSLLLADKRSPATRRATEGAVSMGLDDALLPEYMDGFHGYGRYEAPYWFVGMEEGSTGKEDEITDRISAWEARGKLELDDLVGFHRATGLDSYFQQDAKLCPTWRGLIRLLLAAEGVVRADVEQVRSFQRTELGRIGGTNALIELFPLPAKSLKHWSCPDHSRICWLQSRKDYYQQVGPTRIRHLKERICRHQPKAVICYGLRHECWWEKIAGQFEPSGLPDLRFAFCGHTLVALIPHTSQGRGSKIQFLEKAGETIAARLGSLTIPPAANARVTISEANMSAAADPCLAPEDAPQRDPTPQPARAQCKERARDLLAQTKRAEAATKEWQLVTGLDAQGLDRPAISKQTGITYSRLTRVLWHQKYGVGAIPGMPEYSKEKKTEAQQRYEADVAAKKAAKA